MDMLFFNGIYREFRNGLQGNAMSPDEMAKAIASSIVPVAKALNIGLLKASVMSPSDKNSQNGNWTIYEAAEGSGTAALIETNRTGDNGIVNMVMPVWHWGIFYELLIKSVLSGSFKRDWLESDKGYNYWWGMSAGVIDLIVSREVPSEVRALVNAMKKHIVDDSFDNLTCDIVDQNGVLRHSVNGGPSLNIDDLTKMEWLVDNVIGDIPMLSDLDDNVREVVEYAGVAREEQD
jgi:hypothetical protein